MLSSMEEGRRTDNAEVKKMREQLFLFQKEYNFYKDMAQKLELRQSEDLDGLNFSLRDAEEKLKDQNQRMGDLERENVQLVTQNRHLMNDLSRQQKDIKSIMQINDEYQIQALAFQERETQFSELAREYKEKLELLKFERERLALKEEQFIRQVHKAESTQKAEVKKTQVTYEQKLTSRQRDMEKRVEDLEDKLNSTQDEAEVLRSKVARLESLNSSQRQSLEEWQRKEDRLIMQYDKLLENLRSEIKDKEREAHALETRWAYSKQEVVNQLHELQLKMDVLSGHAAAQRAF